MALGQQSCPITQITNTTGPGSGQDANTHPSIDASGTRIAFTSNRDFTGQNGGTQNSDEIFLFDTTTNMFTQITDTPAGGGSSLPSISSDGGHIVFNSSMSGGGLFLFDTATNTLTHVTSNTSGERPSISSDGTRIAFSSGNGEIFLFDRATNSLSQITNSGGTSYGPAISGGGTRIAFTSEGNLTGGNPDGNRELFLYNTTTTSLSQITNSTGSNSISERPVLNATGTRIAFHSSADLTGGNPGGFEVFLYDTTTNTITQITIGHDSIFPAIDAAGTHIAFESRADLTGGNPDNSLEIFLFDTATSTFTQITNTTGPLAFSARVTISGDGTRIAFYSFANPTGGNADGNGEIFLATCGALPPPSPLCQASTSNSSNFNGTAIPGGRFIWFNSNFTAKGIQDGIIVTFQNVSIDFTANGTPYHLTVPNAEITFSAAATCASTVFDDVLQTWHTTVPLSGSDEILLSGLTFAVPAQGLPGGINPVTWHGTVGSSTSGFSLQWKWGAAVYSAFSTDYDALGVKPTHTSACTYANSDHAGTPENFKSFVVGGARGGGGSNYTGSWSGTRQVTPVCQ